MMVNFGHMLVKVSKEDLDPVDLVLDIFEQVDACGKGRKKSSVDSDEDEIQTSLDDDKRSHVKKKIITIDDSSDDEDVIFETTLATATASTSEVSSAAEKIFILVLLHL